MNKKDGCKNPLKPKAPFKWGFMETITATPPESLTSETTLSNHLLIFDASSKIPKLYGMEIITTEEVMDKLDMFQDRFEKIDKFGWWDLERISSDAGTQFTSMDFRTNVKPAVFGLR